MNTQLQTIRKTLQDIAEGETPWVALGNFMNYWFAYAKDHREELVRDALEAIPEERNEVHRWAVFCAASVEHLCTKYAIPCPEWVNATCYHLDSPWYHFDKPRLRPWLMRSTPEAFTKRNIFCGDRIFVNKWELLEEHGLTREYSV